MGTYHELKKANPRLPILVRECEGATAKLIARYGACCPSWNTVVSLAAPADLLDDGMAQTLDTRSLL